MDIVDFVEAAKTYDQLGWAVQGQLDDLLDNSMLGPGDLNENAVSMIERFSKELYDYHGVDTWTLDESIESYKSLEEDEEEID